MVHIANGGLDPLKRINRRGEPSTSSNVVVAVNGLLAVAGGDCLHSREWKDTEFKVNVASSLAPLALLDNASRLMMPDAECNMIVPFEARHVFAKEVHINRPPPSPPPLGGGRSPDQPPPQKKTKRTRPLNPYLFHLNKYMSAAAETMSLDRQQLAVVRREFQGRWKSLSPAQLDGMRQEWIDWSKNRASRAIELTTDTTTAADAVFQVSRVMRHAGI